MATRRGTPPQPQKLPDDAYYDEADLPDEDNNPAERGDDFLAFWDEHVADERAETTTIFGVEVEVPTDMPLALEGRMRLMNSAQIASDEEIESFVAELFGDDVYGSWREQGMTARQFGVVFTWGITNARGQKVDFAEAAKIFESSQVEAMPAPPANRAERRAADRPRGSASGGASKPTSRGSTTSRRRSSRG